MLSIIIPAYNEEKNISALLKNLFYDVAKTGHQFEVIVVNDGSSDQTLEKLAEIDNPHLKVVSYQHNRGKGYALTQGVKCSSGAVVTFLDAGGDFDNVSIDKFIKLMEVFEADIVIGSKRHPASQINYPPLRRLYSYFYHLLVRLLFNLNLKDTQTGLKVFRREVLLKILPRAVVKEYAFDLELLVIAQQLGFRRIFEAPIKMNFNLHNTGINFKTVFNMLKDTLAIFYRKNFLRYYDRAHIIVRK